MSMRNKSHKTLIAIVRDHVTAWRKAEGWSRESVVSEIVATHDAMEAAATTGIRFEPNTQDTFDRSKVNADRVFRWLDDDSKDTNLLPANFLPSILAAMPMERRRHCLNDILRPLGLVVRVTGAAGGELIDVNLLNHLLREQTEAVAAAAALLDGDVTHDELVTAHRETSEAVQAGVRMRTAIEARMADAGIGVAIAAREKAADA
ncbi:toxin YdaT family protein [Achromobacter aloeverae]